MLYEVITVPSTIPGKNPSLQPCPRSRIISYISLRTETADIRSRETSMNTTVPSQPIANPDGNDMSGPDRKHASFLLAALLAFILAGCASQRPPEGGPPDTEPPFVVETDPADGVITSYSIHYTKLYECSVRLNSARMSLSTA